MSKTRPTQTVATTPWLALSLPFFLLLVLLFASPNFRWSGVGNVRTGPYGADFLQDWIGGQIVLSSERARLYDAPFSNGLQHDTDNIGFTWPEENFFPMVYPPFHYLLVSPLSLLPYRYAFVVWSLLSTIAFSGAGWLLYRFYPPVRTRFGLTMLALTLFVPWVKCLSMGQKASFLWLLFTATFLLLDRRKDFLAGLVFGLVAIKPQLGIVIGLLMLWQLRWKFVAGSALTISILVGTTWLLQPNWWPDYWNVIGGMGDYLETGGYQLADSHSLWGGLRFSFPALPGDVLKIIVIVLSLLLLVWIGIVGRRRLANDPANNTTTASPDVFQFSSWVLATALISPHFCTYDFTILLLPLVLILSQTGLRPNDRPSACLIGIAIAFYALSGSFTSIATSIGFQLSLLLIATLVFLLGSSANDLIESSQKNKSP